MLAENYIYIHFVEKYKTRVPDITVLSLQQDEI